VITSTRPADQEAASKLNIPTANPIQQVNSLLIASGLSASVCRIIRTEFIKNMVLNPHLSDEHLKSTKDAIAQAVAELQQAEREAARAKRQQAEREAARAKRRERRTEQRMRRQQRKEIRRHRKGRMTRTGEAA